jgi:hypothetical protein
MKGSAWLTIHAVRKGHENVEKILEQGDQIGQLFLPVGDCLHLGSFSKITQVAQIIGLLFYSTRYVLIFSKHGLGYILGDFCVALVIRLPVESGSDMRMCMYAYIMYHYQHCSQTITATPDAGLIIFVPGHALLYFHDFC